MTEEEQIALKKIPNTLHEIYPLIKQRYSPRIFSEQQISDKEINRLLEAGSWAPSSYNRQPWRIIYGKKGDGTYERIYEQLGEFNQKWADNAPVLMVGIFKKDTDDGNENFHALHDLGLFMATLTFQATAMNIAVHQMAGIDFESTKKEFEIPENYHVATGVAIGYYGGDLDSLGEELKEQETAERERNPLEDFVFNGNFKK